MKAIPLILLFSLLCASSAAQVQVPAERIAHAAAVEPGNWLTHHGDYAGHRHSQLAELTPVNIAELKPAWVYQSREAGKWECTPLVIDGIIYITERPNIVTALDARTGRVCGLTDGRCPPTFPAAAVRSTAASRSWATRCSSPPSMLMSSASTPTPATNGGMSPWPTTKTAIP
jgi:hypothetical protein